MIIVKLFYINNAGDKKDQRKIRLSLLSFSFPIIFSNHYLVYPSYILTNTMNQH